MAAHEDDNGDDIEALASRAHELCFDMSNFGIYHELKLDGDYDSITTHDEDDLSHDNTEGSVGVTVSPGTDYALAERTSHIISSYRDYLMEVEGITPKNQRQMDETESQRRTTQLISSYRDYLNMEDVRVKNQRLTDEMDSLRGSLGVHRAARDPPARVADVLRSIEIYEEPRSNKYSQPLRHSRHLKKRLFRAVLFIAVMGSIAMVSFSGATMRKEKNLSNLDQKLAEALQEEELTKEALMEDAASRIQAPATEKVQAGRQSTQPSKRTESRVENPAMKMIQDIIAHPKDAILTSSPPESTSVENPAMKIVQDIIAHPKDVTLTSSPPESRTEDILKGIGKSPKAEKQGGISHDVFSKSGKSSTSKSGKTKAEKQGSVSHDVFSKSGKSSSKSGKETLSYNISKTGKSSPVSSSSKMRKSGDTSYPSTLAATTHSVMEATDDHLHLEAASILYRAISSQYNPMFYDRSQGWEGSSFRDAVYFCNAHYPNDSHEHGGVPCPYEAYCPEGPNSIPFGGYRMGTSYAPIIDQTEHWLGWMQLDSAHPCVAYNYLNTEPNEEETQHLMCCKDISR